MTMSSHHRWFGIGLAAVLAAVPGATALGGGSTCSVNVSNASYQEGKADKADIVDTAVQTGKFKTLAAALQAAGLVETLKGEGPFTVFAPTDEAFAKLPEGTVETLLKPENREKLQALLLYHVVAGEVPAADVVEASEVETVQGQFASIDASADGVRVDNANVIATDVYASNGVIHVIDSVLLPRPDLVATASSAGSFGTLLAALEAADLEETLRTGGPFTVFAPTDEAFAKLPDGTVESLLQPENREKLQAVLLYHVVPGRVKAGEVVHASSLETAQGQSLTVKVKDSKVKVGGAEVITTDVLAGNGVIHVIDTVLIPQEKSDKGW